MRAFDWRFGLGLALLTVTLACAVSAQGLAREEGGRDVSVAMFSTLALHTVVITPLSSEAWSAICASCPRQPLLAPMRVEGTRELFAGGAVRVKDAESGELRSASGLWHLRSSDAGIDVVLTLPSERYVAAVLNAEAGDGEPAESLRALAITARTYALNGPHYTAAAGRLTADLCDSTQCQAMRFGTTSAAIEAAVRATAGETLWAGSRRAEVFFSEHCGGVAEDVRAVWPRLGARVYLTGHADPYCLRRGSAAWHAELKLSDFTAIAKAQGWQLPGTIASARVVERSGSHRARLLEFSGASGERTKVSAGALRFGVGRALGWNRVRSDWYEVTVRDGMLIFDGRGNGHGVGLCQAGATEMAREHKDARAILAFYFPSTTAGVNPEDHGWREVKGQGLTLRGVRELSAQRVAEVGRIWMHAKTLFAPRQVLTPEIVFAPSTELFRQLTMQPGWMLASTRGSAIVLQPERVLGAQEESTLLHEMLHVLVEAEAAAKAPLWLREGLVETLAGGAGTRAGTTAETMGTTEIERELAHASSQAASERAHRAAGVRVRKLVERYGLVAVRGWLASGSRVPE